MIALGVISTMLSAAVLAMPARTESKAISVFRDACMTGQAQLPTEEARTIKRNDVPDPVLRQLSSFTGHLTPQTHFYKLQMPEGSAFLVVQSDLPAGAKYCSVGSNHISYWDARVTIGPIDLSRISPSEQRQMERMGYAHTTSTFGDETYETEVRRVEKGFVVMTTFLPSRKTTH